MSFNMNASISEEMCRFELTFSNQNFNEQQETDFIKQSDIFVIINTLALTFNYFWKKNISIPRIPSGKCQTTLLLITYNN